MARVLSHETSLGKQLDAIRREQAWLPRLARGELMLGGLLLAAGAFRWWQCREAALLWGGGLLLFLGLAHRLRGHEAEQQAGRLRAGRRGELNVTRALADALPNSCYILNDVNLKTARLRAQIDHLVITPWGLFVLETKNWAGRVAGDPHAERWTQTRRRDGREQTIKVGNPILQNRRHVEVLRAWLRAGGVQWDPIVSVIVFPADTRCEVQAPEVPLVDDRHVAAFIADYPREQEQGEADVDAVLRLLGAPPP